MTDSEIKEGSDFINAFNSTNKHPYLKRSKVTEVSKYYDDWNEIMSVWEYIKTLDKEDDIDIMRLEVDKKSIFLEVSIEKKPRTIKCIYHDFKRNQEDCENMKEVYFKTIVDFILWYNENR